MGRIIAVSNCSTNVVTYTALSSNVYPCVPKTPSVPKRLHGIAVLNIHHVNI